MNILIINGPNLNMLGQREPNTYGTKSYLELERYLQEKASKLNVSISIQQTNSEGAIISLLQDANMIYDGVILNAGAYTHYSYAIYDAILSITIPVIEVHLTNINQRESFRQTSVIKPACKKTFMGKGFESYEDALIYLTKEGKQNDC